jgi:hypothetical protein
MRCKSLGVKEGGRENKDCFHVGVEKVMRRYFIPERNS